MRTGQIYSEEFKETIIELVISGKKTIAELSNELGLSERTIYKWTYMARITKNIGFMTPLQEKKLKDELAKTKKELKHAKREVNILSMIISKRII